MMEVAICSLVRDGMLYLPAYRRQLESLQVDGGLAWRLYILEGDSADESWEFIERWAREDERVSIGRLHVGKAANREELAVNWAQAGNACFGLIPPDSRHQFVLWLEADLCFPIDVLQRLTGHQVDIVAPVIFLGGRFYDTWGFRGLDGVKWSNNCPYHTDYVSDRLIEVASVGSCVLFARKVLDSGIRFRGTYENGLLVGMCSDARLLGMHVFADASTAILHPVSQWQRQLWQIVELRLIEAEQSRVYRPPSLYNKKLPFSVPILDAELLRQYVNPALVVEYSRLGTNRLRLVLSVHGTSTRQASFELLPLPARGLGSLPILGRGLIRLSSLLHDLKLQWLVGFTYEVAIVSVTSEQKQ